MNILGMNVFHGDSSAALVQDGKLVAAIEEERFNRIKHWAGFPAESIRFCLESADLRPGDVDHVAFGFNPRANFWRKILFTLRYRPNLGFLLGRFKRQAKSINLRKLFAQACNCTVHDVQAQFHNVEHHAAHLASAFNVSPFERAALLSIDGMGDFVSSLSAIGEGTNIRQLSRVYYPHSLGWLYQAITLYLGFHNYGDEYKVMGLAPYGEPEFVDQFRQLIRPHGDGFVLNLDYFTHHTQGVAASWEGGSPTTPPFHSPKLEHLLGPAAQPKAELTERHQNIASSLQVVTEEILFHVLRQLHKKYPCDDLCLAGGVAMNSVANGKITENTPFRNIYIPPAAADNGTSFGSAYYVWNQILGQPRGFQLDSAAWGTQFTDQQCRTAIESRGLEAQKLDKQDLLETIIDTICDGRVVGWFQGKMELGARALGNRSLLADPRRTDMRDIINLKIKFREKFRPFAPSIMEEHVSDYFESDQPSPFMERVLKIRPEKRDVIPAVTHVDGTGRLQTVSRSTNPLYWELINKFASRTGVPIILNTSLNENEPIVNEPGQALDCMLRTQMDAIVLGSYFVKRPATAQAAA